MNEQTDPNNCGTCGAACSAAGSNCQAGRCFVTLASGQNYPFAIAVDATSVYWTNKSSVGGVMKVPLGGGSPTILASGQSVGIAVDATSVYWTYYGSSTVMKAPK